MTTQTHPNHLRNRIAMANRFADRVTALATETNRALADTVADLMSLDTDEATSFWSTLATLTGERAPSEATVAATVAILVERS